MEGRHITQIGKDEGDLIFHVRDWNSDPEAQKKDLERIDALKTKLMEQQIASFLDESQKDRAFIGLIQTYPNHPRRPAWEEHLKKKPL